MVAALERVRTLPAWPVLRWAAVGVGAFAVWLLADNVLDRGIPAGVVVLGTVFGSLYALIAVGLVLIFRANRVVNFAQAELGARRPRSSRSSS